ncbi:MAG: homogentisate 1,2-dioxygenase [Acidimicrobiales bacterium]
MPSYRRVGDIPPKRHQQFRGPDGRLRTEQLMSSEGFSEESALSYHLNSPMAIVAAETLEVAAECQHENEPLLPRHFRLHGLKVGGDAVMGRQLCLANEDVRMSYVAADSASPLFRNATGDELFYVEAGGARLDSEFGSLELSEGDYAVVPTNTTYRLVPAEVVRLLVLETRGHLSIPARYLSTRGQLKEGAPFSERDLRGPSEPLLEAGTDVSVIVRTRSGLTRYTYKNHPFDVVGWDGCLYPWAFSIHDFEPIVGSVHQPPPVHQTLAAPGLVVCSFVPRPFDFGPNAVPVPYAHANIDSDEVLFYVGGDFMSRAGSGIGQGSVSLHPTGFVHGPQPGSVEKALQKPGTDELAVMVDTFRPLRIAGAAELVEDAEYAWTWARNE